MKKGSKYILPVLTVIAAIGAILSILVFTLRNQENITSNNREYLRDHTTQMALLVDNSLMQGVTNIQALSSLLSGVLTSPELDIGRVQYFLDDSLFDFVEFADIEGMNHNTTGGVSYAGDRQYYLEAMKGNSGIELIFNSRATNQTLLAFYSPVYYRNEIIGSLIGIYNEALHLDRLLATDMFGYTAAVYLCNEDGTIISSNQNIDTTGEVSIKTVLGSQAPNGMDAFLYGGETDVLALEGNETGACVMGLENSGWFIVEIFPKEANQMMVAKANQIGIESAVALLILLTVLLILTYTILDKSRMETHKALVKAEAASKAKTEFLFHMSHDIRTPMNAITGFLRLLNKQQEDPVKRKEYIHKISDASQLLLSIINNVLEMSKIEGGTAELNETAWSAGRMCDCVYSMFAGPMQEKNIEFEKTVDVQHPFVWCDASKIQEIFLNLLSNAYKYTLSGGKVSMRLTELPSDKEGYAVYQAEIQDSGIGIAKEFMPHLFEEFARESDTTHSKIHGTGLGLPIVKRLTELMGGSVSAESEVGRGTRIAVVIPHRIAAETEICGVGTGGELPVFSGKRVLLAEDNDLNAEIAVDLLGEMGLEVEWAQDGRICVEMLERTGAGYYDLVLMDIQMPNMNGYQAAKAIRGMDDLAKASIPIIAMTANAFEEDKENAFAAGMDGHLAKPIDISKLVEALTDILG